MQISCPSCKAAFKLQPEVLRQHNTRSFACPKCQANVPVPDHVFDDAPFDATRPPETPPTPPPGPAPQAPPAPAEPEPEPPTTPAPTSPFPPGKSQPPASPEGGDLSLVTPDEDPPPVSGTVVGMQSVSMDAEAVPDGWTFSLVCMSGPCNGEKRGIDQTPFVLGREEGDWPTADPHMSGKHFHILIRGPEFQVMDLGSTNGTVINGTKIAGTTTLGNRDEIQAGSSTFLFVAVKKSDLEDDYSASDMDMEMEAPVPEDGAEEATSLAGPALVPGGGTIPNTPESFRVFLEILEGPDKGKTVDLSGKQTLVVGRGKDADLILTDQTCSRKHCQVLIHAMGDYGLRDLASTNGTYLNGQRIMQEKMKNLDTFRLGRTTIRFNALKAAW